MPKYSTEQINKLLTEKQSPRYQALDKADSYYRGTCYQGKVHFWDNTVALLDRAPSVVYPIVQRSIRSITSFCLGDTHFPKVLSGASENAKIVDPTFGLSDKDSETFDAAVDAIFEQVRMRVIARQAMETGLAQRTTVAICGIQNGRLNVSMIPAKWATPTFCATRPDEVESLTITYRYKQAVYNESEREWQDKVFEFLRVIDETKDTTFVPVEIKPKEEYTGSTPIPTAPDPAKTFTHGFKFCPVIWYKRKADCSTAADIDGKAIHDGLYDQIDALNYALSARNRAAIYSSDPQLWEAGVLEDETPGGLAAGASPRPMNGDTGAQWQQAVQKGFLGGSGGALQRKKGASTVWTSANPEYKVGMLSLPGDALKAISDDAQDEKQKLYEAMGVIDPTALTGLSNISTQTLKLVFSMHIATCDEEREDFGRMFLLPLLNMLLRIVLRTDKGLWLMGADKLRPMLKKFERPVLRQPGAPVPASTASDPDDNVQWFPPLLTLKWGDYFTPSEDENAKVVDHTTKAVDAGLITQQMGVEKMRGIHKFQSSDQVLTQVKQEKAQKQADAIANAQAMAPKPTPATPKPTPSVPTK